MPTIDLNTYVTVEEFAAFMNEEGILECTGLPTLGVEPAIEDQVRYKEKYVVSADNTGVMAILMADVKSGASTLNYADRTSQQVRFAGEFNLTTNSSGMGLGVKMFEGDNFGVLEKVHLSTGTTVTGLAYKPDPVGAIQVGVTGSFEFVITPIDQEHVQGQVVPEYAAHLTTRRINNQSFLNDHGYLVWISWHSTSSTSAPPPVKSCSICTVRVPGKQWPGQLPTTTTSSSGRIGSHQRYLDLKSRHLMTRANREKVDTKTRMEASRHSRPMPRLVKSWEKKEVYIGPPL